VVVGIGASAGGAQVLQAFFRALPANSGAAYVVVVHLDPDRPSEMVNILGLRTKMPVTQVGAPERLQADHVYVISPNRRVQISDHEIAALEFNEPRGHHAPIDLFFRSLSRQHGDGFAIILTGVGSDCAIGIKAVKEIGGIILVQDPDEAEYPSMPRAAISTGVVDFVLPINELAQQLVELIKDKANFGGSKSPLFSEDILRRILAHVRVRTGHDFAKYKRAIVLRRIARRMHVTRSDDPAEYYNYLRDNSDEVLALLGDLLISVTTFFRDQEVFDTLKTDILPQLFQTKLPGERLRVWVPGCATGEEAYTIAILMLEEAGRHELRPPIQLFGSDLDTRAPSIAREGRYPAAIEADITEERLQRFFTREGDQYRVRQELRDTVLFANHSVLKDPPSSHIDLISCRNLLIYLDRELQQQVCSTFHYALNLGGFLLVGASETADNPSGLFRTVDRKARIYQSMAQSGDKPRLLPRVFERPEPALSLPIPVRFNDAPNRVLLHVKPTVDQDDIGRPRQAVVLFIEGEPVGQIEVEDVNGPDKTSAANETVRRLSEELQLTQARLRTAREESETTTKELRVANEELQSINEEYRSTSEELETSKEELQSISEELQTVNSELKLKLEAVARAHSDLQNLIAATDFGTLFLDAGLRIKGFTQQVTELFSITPSDEGRPVTDFAHRLEYDDLVKDAQKVLSHLTPIKREVHSRTDRWFDVRLRPYRTVDNKIDGVVITFVDITERKATETRMTMLLRELTHRVKNTLAVVQSIAHQSLRHTDSPSDFVDQFDGRLAALAKAHAQLVEYDWKGADLGALIRQQLDGIITKPDRVRIDGEAIMLPADLATPFGRVLHELATNASKYGALSSPAAGKVSLS